MIAKPLCNVVAFALLIKPTIAATRTNDDTSTRGILLGNVGRQFIGIDAQRIEEKGIEE